MRLQDSGEYLTSFWRVFSSVGEFLVSFCKFLAKFGKFWRLLGDFWQILASVRVFVAILTSFMRFFKSSFLELRRLLASFRLVL